MNYVTSLVAVSFFLAPAVGLAGDISVCFTPASDCETQIVRTIEATKKELLIQAYVFTAKPIADAVINAHRRGVKVAVVLDKSQLNATGAKVKDLRKAGVPVVVDSKHAIAHSKIILIDGGTIITGSYNFTKAAATRHAENVLFIRDPELFAAYLKNFEEHYAHSKPYEVRHGSHP